MLFKQRFPIEKQPSGVISRCQQLSLHGELCFDHCFVAAFNRQVQSLEQLLLLLDGLFYWHPQIKHLQLPQTSWHTSAAWQAFIAAFNAESVSRFEFYSHPINGLNETPRAQYNERFAARACPPRNRNLTQQVYRRFDHELGKWVSFKVAHPHDDLARFYTWMHDPRVSEFWQMELPKEALKRYLANKLTTPYNLPLIGYFDDEPFGYFEVYWASEDRIASYYPWQAHDRGLHLLVGNEAYRGTPFFKAWCKAITHFMFLDCPDTQKIVLEPRYDNHRLLNQITKLGFIKEYEFAFPHKRAALVSIEKVNFYKENFQC
ncbi:GNAT family N-acetyltransferase [Pseudoalteromonas sp.]|uniref:GNAT family N-acetyltransferase n=1 Tax=Pseudoalteromonas sp. TaxID=53249 RepID=UPI003566B582